MLVAFGDERAHSREPRRSPRTRSKDGARMITPTQVQAIREAMRVFVEDDLAGGQRTASRWCDRCRAARPAAGFIDYAGGDLCNDCATDYELARANGITSDVAAFIASHARRAPTRAR
jgi:hypothetical protein